MRKSDLTESDHFRRAWGGNNAVLVFQFANGCALLAAVVDDTIRLSLTDSSEDLHSDIERFASTFNCEEDDEIIGLFDLDTVLSPVPEWQHLCATNATVISKQEDGAVLGICISVNLGIRIGMFVAPHAGATLSFNDSCDEIVRQAVEAEKSSLVKVETKSYTGRETPKQVNTIDWFDWLRLPSA